MLKCDFCGQDFETKKIVNVRMKNDEKEWYYKFCCWKCFENWMKQIIQFLTNENPLRKGSAD